MIIPPPTTKMSEQTVPAVVLKKVRDIAIEHRPNPKLVSPKDVKVQVKATG
jgi:threonine dehydrogenase-like Zn-dependent dehydrogenase